MLNVRPALRLSIVIVPLPLNHDSYLPSSAQLTYTFYTRKENANQSFGFDFLYVLFHEDLNLVSRFLQHKLTYFVLIKFILFWVFEWFIFSEYQRHNIILVGKIGYVNLSYEDNDT